MSTIKDIFIALHDNLTLSQYPDKSFKYGIPPFPHDGGIPSLFLDWDRGSFVWTAGMCGGSDLKSGEVDFNAVIAMHQDDVDLSLYPGLLANEALAIHMAELTDTLIANVIYHNANTWTSEFFASPRLPTHSFIKEEPISLVNLKIRISHFANYGA